MADLSFITDHLATGGQVTTLADVQQLVAAGITHVINCRAEFDEGALYTGTPIQYLWNPTADDGQPKPVEWFRKTLAFAIPALAAPVPDAVPATAPTRPRVFAHCAAGVNRGPSAAYAIMLALDWPYDAAEARIRQVRTFVGLAYKNDAITAATVLGY